MATKPTKRTSEFDIIEPIGKRVVVRKDDNKRETKSGIVLPDSHEIPVITGRVIAVSKAIENDGDQTIRQYDKVLFDPREAIPVELEHDNRCSWCISIACWRSFGAPRRPRMER